MKSILLSLLIPGLLFINMQRAKAQAVSIRDSLALVDLYNNTDGPHWRRNTNWLNGPVDSWAGVVVRNSRVTQLNLNSNKLNGSLLSSIGNLTALKILDLSNNALSGSIPESIGNLLSLAVLQLFVNSFSGDIPTSITNLRALSVLNLGSNKLSGSIPDSIGKLNQLTTLDLSGNPLTGSIPNSIGDLTQLYTFYLGGDQLTGSIPETIGSLTRLNDLRINHTLLSGAIPASLCNLSTITFLDLSYNRLSGTIPNNVGNLYNMGVLYLSHNNLSGEVPVSISNMRIVRWIDLSYNNLKGKFTFPHTTIPCDIILSYNHFTETKNVIVPFHDWLGDDLRLDNNNYNFNLLESLAKTSLEVSYSHQANLFIHQSGNILSVGAGGTLSKNTYTWFRIGSADSVRIIGDSTFNPTVNGNYYAKITNAYAKQLTLFTDTLQFTKMLANNISLESVTAVSVTLFPNPVKDVLTINGLDAKRDYNLMLIDEKGIAVVIKQIHTVDSHQLNVQYLKSGIYYIKLDSNNTIVAQLKFEKQ